MSDISLQVVKEYFELYGFNVFINCKHQLQKADASGHDSVDLFIENPEPRGRLSLDQLTLDRSNIMSVQRAIVDIKGWHTERFSPSLLKREGILSFVSPESLAFARKRFGSANFAKILVIPQLPASGHLRKLLAEQLREQGVDFVLEFSRMLLELTAHVKVNYNYTRSDVLQLLRLLKQYHLVREPQLEIPFTKQRRRRRSKIGDNAEKSDTA